MRPSTGIRQGYGRWLAIGAVVIFAAGIGVFFLPQRPSRQPVHEAVSALRVSPVASSIDIPLAAGTIDEIDARRATTAAVFRLDVDPVVLILDFPVLHMQAQMLNRVAALIEKADTPHDRVMKPDELDEHIRATGGDPDAYYYGHDYRAADLARFFQLAAQQHLPLNPYEAWLHDLLEREGWLKDYATGALISIPGVSTDIDASSRTTIFRHELSHAVYFTDPDYRALTQHFWAEWLTAPERDAVRGFLKEDGYDTQDEDLMANEAQAYLIHTRDPRYFMPVMLGMSADRETALRSQFVQAIPEEWLRESALAVAPITPVASAQPVSAATLSAPERPPLRVHRAGEGRPSLVPELR